MSEASRRATHIAFGIFQIELHAAFDSFPEAKMQLKLTGCRSSKCYRAAVTKLLQLIRAQWERRNGRRAVRR